MIATLVHFFNSGQVGWLGLAVIPVPVTILWTTLRRQP